MIISRDQAPARFRANDRTGAEAGCMTREKPRGREEGGMRL
jgi:hypothetical protein